MKDKLREAIINCAYHFDNHVVDEIVEIASRICGEAIAETKFESAKNFVSQLEHEKKLAVQEEKPINLEFSKLSKAERDDLILGAIDNVQNPKRDVTFEQAHWLRFVSYLRKKGWYIAKFEATKGGDNG